MTVTAVRKDPDALTMTLTAEFDASPERVWQLWADPRQLERWWGPPTYPATFTKHDLAPGSRVEYHMTGPEGDQPKGYWDILEAEPPHRLVVRDGFANDDGTPNDDFPTRRDARDDRRGRPGSHAHVDREPPPEPRGDGAGPCHGHGGGPDAGRRPDRRDPRRGRRRPGRGTRQLTRWPSHRWGASSAPGSSNPSSMAGRRAAAARRSSGSRMAPSCCERSEADVDRPGMGGERPGVEPGGHRLGRLHR